jgi:hypothetical protein
LSLTSHTPQEAGIMKIACLSLLVAVFAVGCAFSSDPQQPDESTASQSSELKGGCHVVCPVKCHPGEMCPMIACLKVCPKSDGTVACGPTNCLSGEVCCNQSCGICTPAGGVCTQQMCVLAE